MNKVTTGLVVAASMIFSFACLAEGDVVNLSKAGPHQPVTAIIDVDTSILLTVTEETDLAFMREEEKLARDVYLHLNDTWGARVFANISNAEQKHMDSVKVILDAYQLADPAVVDRGFFTDPDLQDLYDQLVAQGDISLEEALKVGALIEEVDINDLYRAINDTRNPAIIQMYASLLNGSYQHLNSFVEQLRLLGGEYTAQVLSAEEVASILAGETFSTDIVDASAIDVNGVLTGSNSRFSYTLLVNSIIQGDDVTVSNGEHVASASYIIPQADHISSEVAFLVVASYLDASGSLQWFVRNGQQWQSWDGDIPTLASAGQLILGNMQYMDIFNGQLTGLEGEVNLYVGYRLADGTVVFSQQPMHFTVTE